MFEVNENLEILIQNPTAKFHLKKMTYQNTCV